MTQIGDHAAGNLMQVLRLVVGERFADGKPLGFSDGGEMFFDGLHFFIIHHRRVAEGAQISRDIQNRWLRRAVGERWHRCVQRSDVRASPPQYSK